MLLGGKKGVRRKGGGVTIFGEIYTHDLVADEMKVWMPRPMRYVYTFIWSTFIPIVLLFMVFSANSGRVADSTDGRGRLT